MMLSLGIRIFNPNDDIFYSFIIYLDIQQNIQIQSFKVQELQSMPEFETQIYKCIPPFGTSLFHRKIQPHQQSFIQMARFTFFPYFTTYTFTFFWAIIIAFVFFYSQSYRIPNNFIEKQSDNEFLKVSQAALFQLGQNYPYHIVNNYHYYRVLTSMVLFCNFNHFMIVCVGVITLGSYVEKILGFKRCFVLAITTGVIGILFNNVFNKNVTVESLSPMSGIIGYSFGYFIEHRDKEWKYHVNEKIHMILILVVYSFLYTELIISYSNINFISNIVALAYGFLFCFADASEKFTLRNILAIIVMAAALAFVIIIFFFHTKPAIIQL